MALTAPIHCCIVMRTLASRGEVEVTGFKCILLAREGRHQCVTRDLLKITRSSAVFSRHFHSPATLDDHPAVLPDATPRGARLLLACCPNRYRQH